MFYGYGDHRYLHVLTHSFPTRRSSDLGLPYAFASHFAPGALDEAVAIYRRDFQPSAQLAHPYVMAGRRADLVVLSGDDRRFLEAQEIGRAHVCTPVTNAHLVCRLLLEKKNNQHEKSQILNTKHR